MSRLFSIELELEETTLRRIVNALNKGNEPGLADLVWSNAQEVDNDEDEQEEDNLE